MNTQLQIGARKVSKKLGALINATRTLQGISTRDLAKKSGLSHSYISRFERGEQTNIGIEKLIQLTTILGINIGSFLNEYHEETKKNKEELTNAN